MIVDFVYKEDNIWWYLTGKIVYENNDTYIVRLEDTFKNIKNLQIHKTQIIEEISNNKKNTPEELCKEFRFANSIHEKSMIEVFTNGLCYVFATWLKSHLYKSEIYYINWEYHYVVKYQDKYYDITGDVTEEYGKKEMAIHRYYGDWRE